MTKRFADYDDRREWDLSGYTLDQIALDYALRLLIAKPDSSVEIVIETAFELHRGESVLPIAPELTVTTIPVLSLLHQSVARLTVFHSGALYLRFENGAEIRVPNDDIYEAWQATGTGEMRSPHPSPPWGG